MSLVDHPERTPHTSPFSWQDDSEKQDPGNFRYTPLLKWHEWNRHADRPQVGDPFPSSENHKSQLDVFLRTNNTLHTSYPLIQRSRASTTGRLASSRSRSKEEQQIPWDKLTDDEAIQTEYESSQALSQYFLKASNGGVGHSQHQSPSPRVVELGSPPHSPRELLGPPPASHEKRGSYVKGGTARSGIEEFFESALDDYLSRSSQPYSANVLQQAETLAQPPTRSALVQTAPSSEGKNLRSFRAGQSQDGLGPDGANTTTVGTSPGLDFDQAAVDKAMAQIQAGDMSSWFL
ncbi:hypothetical protein IAR55_001220 [Kwoniella newhampshirensis]|uniref:Uncharacterized protein n=1 Tax=Kwoniella newhampshirensis TaxID=1651941 RepID=A0AAW0Z553_9TREE